MRFCRYRRANGQLGEGIERDGSIVPLEQLDSTLPPHLRDWMTLGEALPERLAKLDSAAAIEEPVRLLAPVPHPEKIICVGLNYRDHAIETGAVPPTEPVIFSKLSSTIVGPDDPIILPQLSDRVDFEAELVVVLGSTCRDVEEAEAMQHVFGYCCGHDVSARDWQKEHCGGQWLMGKSFDTFAPLGPYVVHKSLVPEPGNLAIEMRIGDEVMQRSRTNELIFSIPTLISFLSKIVTLRPGDLIFTGTPAGVGAARTPPRFLQPGDHCQVTIESLGTLRNRCVAHDSAEAEQWRKATA
ncbi:fumarylacetoacetate hydrolase family protein [Candidatus Laterigemmans baculatus]|uniref:fumarylacetoacetate hydrolase family protein n=1 Tax=Candidatus Laterigemmans baculatus TaxID=2770505 RepID=UPI0013DAAB40|nr:fumarylacetoacetate hydrolase family protein [Candidatus Laterigemmans baculatus]